VTTAYEAGTGADTARQRFDASDGRSRLATLADLLPGPLSLGAAAIHFAVIGEHFEEFWAFGLFFAGTGWFQAWWAVEYSLRSRTRLLWALGVLVNAGIVAIWIVSRVFGLPFGPHPGEPEPIGLPDVTATVLEGILVILMIVMAARWGAAAFPPDRRRARSRLGPTLVAGVIALATTLVLIAPRPG
jgi:hypothetical protein